jgi:hypothetical protein
LSVVLLVVEGCPVYVDGVIAGYAIFNHGRKVGVEDVVVDWECEFAGCDKDIAASVVIR